MSGLLLFATATRPALGATHSLPSSAEVYRLGYGLDDMGSIPERDGDGILSLHHSIHTDSGGHPASYPVGTGGSFTKGKAARACC